MPPFILFVNNIRDAGQETRTLRYYLFIFWINGWIEQKKKDIAALKEMDIAEKNLLNENKTVNIGI